MALWPAVVDAVRGENALLAAALAEGRPVAVEQGDMVLAFPSSATFQKRQAENEAHRQVVASALRTLGGASLRVRCELREREEGDTPAAPAAPPDEDLVDRFVAAFDAEELIDDEEGA